ncbi:hypothetical protein [Thauera sp.]|uniref:hypothetical protein n=1 Tax=Thauera sp. TaxID=1905334 RepID=UPI0039E275F3
MVITKVVVLSAALSGIAGFATMLDEGHGRVVDSLVQMPAACQLGEAHCQHAGSPAKASTTQFFAMLSSH